MSLKNCCRKPSRKSLSVCNFENFHAKTIETFLLKHMKKFENMTH